MSVFRFSSLREGNARRAFEVIVTIVNYYTRRLFFRGHGTGFVSRRGGNAHLEAD